MTFFLKNEGIVCYIATGMGQLLTPQQIEQISVCLQRDSKVEAAYLFGSIARGKSHAGSDVDIALVLSRYVSPDDFSDYRIRLSVTFSEIVRRNVDLVIFNQVSPILKHQILLEGQRIYERPDRLARNQEALAMVQYFDFLPIFERCKEGMFRKIKERASGAT